MVNSQRAVAKTDWGQAGRAAQALLCAAVNGVDSPVVHAQLVAAEAGHGVDDQQGAGAVHDVGQTGDRVVGAGAGFGVHDADAFGLRMLGERAGDLGAAGKPWADGGGSDGRSD